MKKFALSLCSLSLCSTGFAASRVHERLCSIATARLPSVFEAVEVCTEKTQVEVDVDGNDSLLVLNCEANEMTTFWIDRDTMDVFENTQIAGDFCH